MVVHAHPDDESPSTGGVLAKYGAEGVTTVLVTCTDGGCGDGPGGVKPGEPGHDPAQVAAQRARELEASAKALQLSHVEMLGYKDSGMMGWEANRAPGAFWSMDPEQAAGPLVELIRKYRPQVVVTYDEHGFYGHPDHIQTHRVTMAAVRQSGIPAKVYETTVPRSGFARMTEALAHSGIDFSGDGEWEEGEQEFGVMKDEHGETFKMGVEDEEVTTTVEVSKWIEAKRTSLGAHASQSENILFLQMDPQLFAQLFGVETFVRRQDSTGAPLPETDLFAGI